MKLKISMWVAFGIAAALMITSFLLPPMGVIDNSVLMAGGILFAFGGLFLGWHAVDKGMDAKVTHGNTTIEINNDEKNK